MTNVWTAFEQVYSTALVVVTQQLSLRHNLSLRQTLTAIHDKSTAWDGLGSALLNLWKQTSLAASIWGTTSVVFYLMGTSILHVSTPALFHLEPYNNTIRGNITTTLATSLPSNNL
jgi:hypothetical protein